MVVENQPDFSERLLEEKIIKFQFTLAAIPLLLWSKGIEVIMPKLAEPVVLVQQLLWETWVQRSLLVC